MAWEEEKVIYAEKLKQIQNGIQRIKQLEGNRLVTPQMERDLDKSYRTAESLLPKLQDDIFEIAIVGLEKAGKSSFSNALTGLNILPTDDKRCTYTSTCIKPGDTNWAKVEFYSRKEFDNNLTDKLKTLGIPDYVKYNIQNLTLRIYDQLFENCDPTIKQLHGNTINQDIRSTLKNWPVLQNYVGHAPLEFHGDELENADFRAYISDPERAIAVKNVTIYSAELKDMPNAVIYDVPGFDSPTDMHKRQTLQRMREADAIVVVSSAKAPSINGPSLEIFRENVDDYGCRLDEKLFVFANKADTVSSAAQLEENMAETFRQWIDEWKIMSPQYRHRFTAGSANAHLGEKVEKGLESRATLESFGRDSGIAEFRDKLDNYYKRERFEVLKKRVTTLLQDVQEVFADSDFDQGSSHAMDYNKIIELAIKTFTELQGQLTRDLADIKHNLDTESSMRHPLRAAITEQIGQGISLEKYRVTEELLDDIKKELYSTNQTPLPTSVNTKVRERRFFEMQQSFTRDILGCAVSRHETVADQILDAFMAAMKVDRHRSDYEELRKKTAVYCELDKKEDDLYYRSLIERFARDLFEVQILASPGHDRKNKFFREVSNFLSLGVFYGQEDAQDQGSLPQNPLTSRLWRLILYPEIVRDDNGNISEEKKAILETIRKTTNLRELDSGIEDLVVAIIKNRGNQAAPAVERAMGSIRQGGTPRLVLQRVKDALQGLIREEDTTTLEDILSTSRYLDDRHSRELNYDYEQVKSDFDDDVLALREALLKAFVPAIDLDKAFNAKESTLIEKISDGLKGDKFQKFIQDNLVSIKRDELEQINGESAQRELDRAVMQQIKGILNEISKAPA